MFVSTLTLLSTSLALLIDRSLTNGAPVLAVILDELTFLSLSFETFCLSLWNSFDFFSFSADPTNLLCVVSSFGVCFKLVSDVSGVCSGPEFS